MNRREFMASSALLALGSLASGCEPVVAKPNGKTVLIIGAGLAGLAAATKLTANGFSVKILESQERVGGRLRTNRTPGVVFDEGASWIHGITKNPITTLARQAGMQTALTDDASIKSFDQGGRVRSAAELQEGQNRIEVVLKDLKKHGNASKSFQDVYAARYPQYAHDRLMQALVSTYVTFDLGDLNQVSSLLYNEGEEFGGPEHMALNGYDTITNYLANGLSISLQTRVAQVDYSNARIRVTHTRGQDEADFVLITLPLGVLKSGQVAFVPPLPAAKQEAILKVGMNCVNKFMLTWQKPFWDDVQYLLYTPDIPDKFNYFVNIRKVNPDANALLTFAYAAYARATETMPDAAVIAEIMAHLRDMYGTATPNPTGFWRTKWQTNEHTFGSYSFTAVGTEMRHFDELASAVANRVFFAGEHTHADYFSTAHGAYLSGIREADKLIDLI